VLIAADRYAFDGMLTDDELVYNVTNLGFIGITDDLAITLSILEAD
jgi:hypothetical protein